MEFQIWFIVDKLSLGTDKTNNMILSKKKDKSDVLIKIDQNLIKHLM